MQSVIYDAISLKFHFHALSICVKDKCSTDFFVYIKKLKLCLKCEGLSKSANLSHK